MGKQSRSKVRPIYPNLSNPNPKCFFTYDEALHFAVMRARFSRKRQRIAAATIRETGTRQLIVRLHPPIWMVTQYKDQIVREK